MIREKNSGKTASSRSASSVIQKAVPVFFLALVALGYVFVRQRQPPPSDVDQIRGVFETAEKAAEEHNIPALLGVVSRDYKDDSGLNRDRLRLLLAQAFRGQAETWVTVNELQIEPHQDAASVSADVTVESRPQGSQETWRQTLPMTFDLRKEAGRSFLVFPTERWRVVRSEGASLKWDEDLLGM
jgi:hypothetical protein